MSTIENAVSHLETMFKCGDVDKLQAECFCVDAMICGEGAPSIASGEVAIREVLAFVMEATPNLTISIVRAQEVDALSICTWLQWSDPGKEGRIEFRSQTVWKKEAGHWKILADMYGMGRFES